VLAQARRIRPKSEHKAVDVAPVTSDAFATAATRPRNSRLDTAKLQAVFGLTLPAWQQGVDRVLAEILSVPE
jgi:dTDP-4-dehydrorhamnose reductase